MKTLVIYDSWYGNTEDIARAIAGALPGVVEIVKIRELETVDIHGFDLIIIGSPTHGGLPTPMMQEFLDCIEPEALRHTLVATFDTRVSIEWVRFIGFAAKRIADRLESQGGHVVVSPEGFYVHGKK